MGQILADFKEALTGMFRRGDPPRTAANVVVTGDTISLNDLRGDVGMSLSRISIPSSGSLSADAARTWDALRPLRDEILPKARSALEDLARLRSSDPAAFEKQREAFRATLGQAREVLEPLTASKMPVRQAERLLEVLAKIDARLNGLWTGSSPRPLRSGNADGYAPSMRNRVAILVSLLASAGLAVLEGCGKDDSRPTTAPQSKGFNGRFRVVTETGRVVLALEEKDGVVRVESNGETITGRVTAPGKAEGGDENGRFEFELRGERLVARFQLKNESGELVAAPEMTFDRYVLPAAEGVQDADLVGHWMSTKAEGDVIHPDPALHVSTSYARDEHMVLDADGSYVTWRLEIGSRGHVAPDRIRGTWKTDERVLYLRREDETDWRSRGRYGRTESLLLLTDGEGQKQIFERR